MGMVTKSLGLLRSHPRYFFSAARKRLHRAVALDYRLGRSGATAGPVSVTFEVTHRCNLRCKMCDLYGTGVDTDLERSRHYGSDAMMSVDDWKRLADQIAPWRPTVALTGGEPLLIPRMGELIRHVKSKGMVVTMTTNGTLMEKLADELVGSGIDSVTVSIDGPPEVHDRIRGIEGAFEKSRAGLDALASAKRRLGRSTPRLQINTTITGDSANHLAEMPALAKSLGASQLQFSHLWFWTPAMVEAHNRQWGAQWKSAVQNLGGLEGLNVDTLVEQVERIRRGPTPLEVRFLPELDAEGLRAYYLRPETPVKPRCISPWMTLRVLPNGDAIPCLDLVLGNVRQTPFEALWNTDKMRTFRDALRQSGAFPACARCCGLFSY